MIATVFASVLAPISVAVGIKYLSPAEKPSTPSTAAVEPTKDKDAGKQEKDKDAGKLVKDKDAGKQDAEVLAKESLSFNGKDLTGFNVYLSGRERDEDPQKVFTVTGGALRISGEEFGWLATQKDYQRYFLHAEYRWGIKTWGHREGKARTSGIVVCADRRTLVDSLARPEAPPRPVSCARWSRAGRATFVSSRATPCPLNSVPRPTRSRPTRSHPSTSTSRTEPA